MLSAEFSRYLFEHPEMEERIPKEAEIILLPEFDDELKEPNLYLMKTMDVFAVEEVVEKLKALPEVFHAEPNFRAEKHSEQPQSD
jgi:hypothetical protein